MKIEAKKLTIFYPLSQEAGCVDGKTPGTGLDVIRVRYRQQRRSVVREIIVNRLFGQALSNYISSQALKFVKKEDQDSFKEDIMEDLRDMDQCRLIIFGVTPEQLKSWIDAQMKKI